MVHLLSGNTAIGALGLWIITSIVGGLTQVNNEYDRALRETIQQEKEVPMDGNLLATLILVQTVLIGLVTIGLWAIFWSIGTQAGWLR